MAARRTRPWLLLPVGLCLAAASTAAVPASPVAAADDGLLGQQIVDAALVPRGAGLSADLLTLRADDINFEVANLVLLRRDAAGWSALTESTIEIHLSSEQANIPWMVDLGDGRFAILATSQDQPRTVIVPVTVDARNAMKTISADEPVIFDGNLFESGAADVDGDGTNELIVSRWIDGDGNGRCSDTSMTVYHQDASGTEPSEVPIKLSGVTAVRLNGAAFGEFDGRPGADMLANVYDTCGAAVEGVERHHLVAIRLADGSIIEDIPSSEADSAMIVPSPPLVVDVDGDGRDEAVVRGVPGFALIDPTNRWATLAIGAGEVPPLAVLGGSAGARPAIVTWVAPLSAPGARVWSTRIERVAGWLVTAQTTSAPYPELPPDSVGVEPAWPLFSGSFGGAPIGAVIDLDRDGCPELILPAATADCLGTGAIRPGPAWLNSRPLGEVGTPDDPRLLVAEGLEWWPSQDGPYPPMPSAALPGAWRGPWTPPFFLAEVALPLDVSEGSVPAPVIDPLADAQGSIGLQGPAGARLLFRVNPLRADEPSIERGMPLAGFMRTEQTENEYISVRRFPAAGGVVTGSEISTIPFAIASEALSTFGGTGDRWSVSAVALDARGQASAVTRTTVVYDRTAPVLTLDEAPLLSPPWPFEAKITGTSEPGVTVRLGDGSPVIADATGAFEVSTRLAPWPQTLQAVAVDPSGNSTPATISVMGGIDVRGFPWPAIAAVAVLIAVLLSSLRGTRRVRSIASMAASADEGGDLVIEELDPGSRYRRD